MAQLFNDALDDAPVQEQTASFAGGEDSFRQPTLLDPDQCQKLVNIIVRDNFEARTRPGADFLGGGAVGSGACKALFYFDTPASSQLLSCFAGSVFSYSGSGLWSTLDHTFADARIAIAQGIDKCLMSDGQNKMVEYNGTTCAELGNTDTDPPIGATILCWHTQRMFAAGFYDVPDRVDVSNFLNFGNGQWNRTTRSFRVGNGDGDPIVAVASVQDFTLCFLKRNSIWLVNTDPANDRDGDQVNTLDFSVDQDSAKLSQGIGCVGRDAWCYYGNDLLFMAQDGVRSIQRMQAAAGQWQTSPPLSQPIQPYIDRINRNAWSGIVATKYQEFAFFFVPLDNSLSNNAVLVWNGRLGKWCGMWTWKGSAVAVTRFQGKNALVFGDTNGGVNQWKDSYSVYSDSTYKDNGADYSCVLWTKSFQFGEAASDKNGRFAWARFSAGNASLNMEWVTDFVAARVWESSVVPTGDRLGIGTFPFRLSSKNPTLIKRSLSGTHEFNEAYLSITSTHGWWFLRNITLAAFINPIRA